MNKTIYIADDDKSIRDLIKKYLSKEKFIVHCFENGKELMEQFDKRRPDMVVLDIMMPKLDGLSVCREIRKKSQIPIVIVSAKDDEVDRIVGLELGGDDYLSKPFSPRELLIRIKKIFRRIDPLFGQEKYEIIRNRDMEINVDSREIKINKEVVDFTTKEFDLIVEFARNVNKVFTRDQLISKIWGYEFIGETRAVDDLVKRIRKKLKRSNSDVSIETVWGYGYKIIE